LVHTKQECKQSQQQVLMIHRFPCLISSFCCTVNKICSVLGYYAVQKGSFLLMFWDNLYVTVKDGSMLWT